MDSFEDQYVLVIDLMLVQDAIEHCHDPEMMKEQLSLALNFTFALEHFTDVIVLRERMSSVAVDKLGVVGENF